LFKKKIGCVIKINNTEKGQCRGLKTKLIENQEITTLTVGDIFLESGIFRATFLLSQIYQPIIVNFRPAYVISCHTTGKT
jgi:hypothetical protein